MVNACRQFQDTILKTDSSFNIGVPHSNHDTGTFQTQSKKSQNNCAENKQPQEPDKELGIDDSGIQTEQISLQDGELKPLDCFTAELDEDI